MAPSSSDLKSLTENASKHLDRAAFDVYEQATSGNDEKPESIDAHDDPSSHLNSHRLAKFSKKIRTKARTHTQEVLHPKRESHNDTLSSSPTAPALAPSPSMSMENDRLYNPLPEYKGMQAKDLIHHPIDTVQSALHGASGAKFAEVVDNQVIPHGANVGLVRAYDKLNSAKNEKKTQGALSEVETLKKERQDAYVRWTMDRHVLKVRQDPPRTMERPRRAVYRKENKEGREEMQWSGYSQQVIRFYAEQYCDQHIDESPELPPANEEAINTSIERLLMTSMAYQTALMKVRHIYRWDNPHETAMYCSAFFLLLMVGHLGAGIILFTLCLVVYRWYHPPTPDRLREVIKHSEDTEKTALNLTQLIEQHGSRGWLDAAIEKMGPAAMLQLEDAADALEIVRNFYEWRDPPRTARTLGVLVVCCLMIVFCPLWLLVRGTQFGIGVMFFGIFPITSHYPQYRHLVSPFRWAFWKISTDAEWAIARIQAEARWTIEATKNNRSGGEDLGNTCNSTARSDADNDGEDAGLYIGKYHCTTKDQQGRLTHGHIRVTSVSIEFETAVRKNTLWTLQWDKVSAISKVRTDDGLCFEVGDEQRKYRIDALKGRNELFTQIIGYSGLSWQVSD
ncbi:hypothetical protein MMC21_008485 [Puttea exsequens]|nr:hypothetical protein [Puttea exsequens]